VMANLYIISGCNGAGKTTASFTILPEMLNCKEFVNADEITKGLSPFQIIAEGSKNNIVTVFNDSIYNKILNS
jgi:predicted ABC-type ATPase